MTAQHHFRELRLRLVEVRAQLRTAKDMHEQALAEATQRAQPQGKNAEERAVALSLALATDVIYQQSLATLRRAEHEAERVEALLEAASDERRAYEWQIRAKLADGLWRSGVQSDRPGDDVSFDDTALFAHDRAADERGQYIGLTRANEQAPADDWF